MTGLDEGKPGAGGPSKQGRPVFEKEWQQRFTRFARQYDADHLVSGWSPTGLRRRLSLFQEILAEKELTSPAEVLDLGCGAGTYVRTLAALGHKVVGLDYSLPSLHRAIRADSRRAASYAGGEAYHLPFGRECFDLVVCIGVFQALKDPQWALDEIIRVLRPGGMLLAEFLNAWHLFALARSIYEKIAGRLPRLQTYSPFLVHLWFARRGFTHIRRAGVYLPPRQLPWLDRLFRQKRMIRLLERIPGLALSNPHAFLITGEKGPAGLLQVRKPA